jgi:hypothetical protein
MASCLFRSTNKCISDQGSIVADPNDFSPDPNFQTVRIGIRTLPYTQMLYQDIVNTKMVLSTYSYTKS